MNQPNLSYKEIINELIYQHKAKRYHDMWLEVNPDAKPKQIESHLEGMVEFYRNLDKEKDA